MARQFIYHMHGTSKVYPSGKKVLDGVNLSFYPDAKIGGNRLGRKSGQTIGQRQDILVGHHRLQNTVWQHNGRLWRAKGCDRSIVLRL